MKALTIDIMHSFWGKLTNTIYTYIKRSHTVSESTKPICHQGCSWNSK